MVDKIIDIIQEVLVYFTIGLTALCVIALLLFDTVAGAGIMYYLTSGNLLVSLGISLATSGLLILLMVLFYSHRESPILFISTAVVFLLDVAFDSLSADVLRYGQYVNLSGVPNAELQWMFRVLMAGLSTVGDAVAMSIIVGMPVIKNILKAALPKQAQKSSTETYHKPDIYSKSGTGVGKTTSAGTISSSPSYSGYRPNAVSPSAQSSQSAQSLRPRPVPPSQSTED